MSTDKTDSPEIATPEQALDALIAGNRRFMASRELSHDHRQRIAETAGGQSPFAAVLSCIDSRVPAEIVFDQGIGDIFSARVAGNVVNPDMLGSLEFACKVAGSKLILVLGHSSCGAVKGACDGVELGNLSGLLARVRPALDAITDPSDVAERSSANSDFVQRVAEENVRHAVAELRTQSPVLAEMLDAGEIGAVGAMYDVASGEVRVLVD